MTGAATARDLFRDVHGHQNLCRDRARLYVPERPIGMGTLEWLEVDLYHGGLVEWRFESPLPRLTYTRDVPGVSRGRCTLWLVGGCYRIDGRGLHNLRCASPLSRLDLEGTRRALGRQAASYERTHGGLRAREALAGGIPLTDQLVGVGMLHAAAYRTEKKDLNPRRLPWRHPFAYPPEVTVTADGRQIVFVGGSYTVTAHGIEDVWP